MKQRIRIEFTAIEQGACEMLCATLRTFYNKGWIDRDYSMDLAPPQDKGSAGQQPTTATSQNLQS